MTPFYVNNAVEGLTGIDTTLWDSPWEQPSRVSAPTFSVVSTLYDPISDGLRAPAIAHFEDNDTEQERDGELLATIQ